MKIYVDVLMITNAVITLMYLRCMGRVMREKISVRRETAACALGGSGSLIAALHSSSFIGALGITLGKLGVITLIILTAFSPRSFSGYVKRLFLYIMCELLLGGACFLLVNITHSEIALVKNYTVYFDISLMQLAVCSAAVYLFILIYETIQRRRCDMQKKYRATYSLGKYEITLPAIADTGNKLCDSFTGTPVVIFRSDELYSRYDLDRPEQLAFYGFRPTPYSTVQGEGVIYVTSKGDVEITSDEFSKKINCCVGVIPSGSRAQCAIFNPCILI